MPLPEIAGIVTGDARPLVGSGSDPATPAFPPD